MARRPPRLLVKTTIAVALVTVALLFLVVSIVTLSVREQVRNGVAENLESTQRLYAALEARRQGEMRVQAATLAESPTLKAALDTYSAYSPTADANTRVQLLATITNELEKMAGQTDADAIVLVDVRHNTLASVGRLAGYWPRGRGVNVVGGTDHGDSDGVVHATDRTFRVISVPLLLSADTLIGTLHVATSLDRAYARSLQLLSRTEIAMIGDGRMLGTTLGPRLAGEVEAAIARSKSSAGVVEVDGESQAFRRLFQVGDTSIYALASIEEASGPAIGMMTRNLALIAVGAAILGLVGSFWLARQLTQPIGQLSASIASIAATRQLDAQLPRTGSSQELDTLTDTFNALMTSVSVAEAQTEAAYTGAIRALAAALDARDPYTAGHSERVSVLSVAIGRVLKLPAADLEVLRLGALLHDIGKIGVPDDVLSKPGPLTSSEYDIIKQHPSLGARILRSVTFLAPHIPIVELHHERPDGRGYPHGLHDADIPLAARIVHVADAYDAMTSARAYRAALPARHALRELWRCAGSEFHADIVGALAEALRCATPEENVEVPELESLSA